MSLETLYGKAWVIERSVIPKTGTCTYVYWGWHDEELDWTPDHSKAQRFARREDAMMSIKSNKLSRSFETECDDQYNEWFNAVAIEHRWGTCHVCGTKHEWCL